jgi:hypothetical protein
MSESSNLRDSLPDESVLTQAYVPFQSLFSEELFSPEDALKYGTVFSDLYMPYEKK